MRHDGIVDDGQRGLQRMGEIAGMTPRFLGLLLVMREQGIQLVDQRPDLDRQRLRLDAIGHAGADVDDRPPHPPQRPEAINRLQARHEDQADAEKREGAHQRRPQGGDLGIEADPRLRDLKAEWRCASRAARHSARAPAAAPCWNMCAVVDMKIEVGVAGCRQCAVPQRAGAERLLRRARKPASRAPNRARGSAGRRASG